MRRYKTTEASDTEQLAAAFNQYAEMQGKINRGLLDMLDMLHTDIEEIKLNILNIENVLGMSTPEDALEDLLNEVEEIIEVSDEGTVDSDLGDDSVSQQ